MVTEVYIIKDSIDDKTNLRQLFESSIFNVNEVVVPRPIGLDETSSMTLDDIYEAYQYQWCLTKAKNKMSTVGNVNGALLLKSSSITNANADYIARVVNELNNNNDMFDLFYLCRWRDDCQKITDVKEIKSINVKIGRTYAPSGLQAIYFSPSGIDVFLGNIAMRNDNLFNINAPLERKFKYEIAEGNIVAWCAIGNIFSYDVTKATTNIDYSKTHECGGVSNHCKKNKDSSAFYNYLWVIIILIIIIVSVITILAVRK